MANEVVIRIKAYDDSKSGLDSVKSRTNRTASDIEGDLKRSGLKIGASLGESIDGGLSKTLKKTSTNVGQSLISGLSKVGAAVSSTLTANFAPALVIGATAAAPVVAGLLGAAVMGGSAGLGVIGGLALAAKDPRVKSAGAELGKSVLADLTNRAKVFVVPALDGIETLKKGFRSMGPDLDKIFKGSAKFVEPLTNGIVAGTRKMMSGIAEAVSNAGPVVSSLSNLFSELGGSIENVFKDLSSDPEAAADSVDLLTFALTALIDEIGDNVKFIMELGGAWNWLIDKLDMGEDATKRIKTAQESHVQVMEDERAAIRGLTTELQAQTDPVFALMNAQERLRTAQDKVTEATKKHGRNSNEAKTAIRNLASASVELLGKTGALSSSFDGKLTPGMKRALEAAGMTRRQVKSLEAQMIEAKRAADRLAGNYDVNVHYKVTRDNFVGPVLPGSPYSKKESGGIVGAAASGGLRSGLTLVGEGGPELAELPPGTMVHPAGTTRNMLQGASGGGDVNVQISAAPRANADLIAVLIEGLRYEIRRQGGIVQTVLGKRVNAT